VNSFYSADQQRVAHDGPAIVDELAWRLVDGRRRHLPAASWSGMLEGAVVGSLPSRITVIALPPATAERITLEKTTLIYLAE